MSEYAWSDEEELVDPDDSVFRLSASAIKDHKRCPYQFYLSRVVGLPEVSEDRGHLELGTAVHESIETVLGDDNWRTPPRRQNQLRQSLISEYRRRNPDLGEDKWEKGLECLETCSKYIPAYQEDMTVRELEAEFEFTLARPDVSAEFKGYIDLITEDGQILDWKTGSIREEDEIIQGAVYMKGYESLYGEPPEKVRFVYLDEGTERGLEPSDENWDEMIKHAKRCIQDVRREQFDPEPTEKKCYWCGHSGFCYANPAGGGGAIDFENFRRRQTSF